MSLTRLLCSRIGRSRGGGLRWLSTGWQQDTGDCCDVVVVGGGVIGVATAYHLTKTFQQKVILITRDPPLTVTSSMSTECYRAYWGADEILTEFVGVDSISQIRRLAETTNNAI